MTTVAPPAPTIAEQIRTLRRAQRIQGFVPIPGVAKLTMRGTAQGSPVVNVLHVSIAAGADHAALQTLADVAADAWHTQVMNALHTSYQFGDATLVSLESAAAPFAVSNHNSGSPGAADGTPLPLSICAVASLRTSLAGRAHRGRVYLSPIIESWLSTPGGDVLTADARNGVINRFQAFNTALQGAQSGLVIASRVHSPGSSTAVTNVLANGRIGTQRRRLH